MKDITIKESLEKNSPETKSVKRRIIKILVCGGGGGGLRLNEAERRRRRKKQKERRKTK